MTDHSAGTSGTANTDRGQALDCARQDAERGTDEFTARRIVKSILAQYGELVADPVRLAAVDRENDALDLQDNALDIGRAAYARGDVGVAERELLLSYNRAVGDSSVYLTALYRRTGEPQMAAGWWLIAQAEGFDQAALSEVLAAAPEPQYD